MKRLLLLSSLAALVACASVPPPTDTVRAAEKAIDEATRSDAEPYARLELHMAREHLELARKRLDQERYDEARRLAEKAMIEAELAETRAKAARAKRNAEEIREHIATLRREIDRTPETTR